MELRKITPDEARELLRLNDNNRAVRKTHVRSLAREIESGSWQRNGDAIRISKADAKGQRRLLDGQHRLSAIIEANKAIETYVIDDLDAEVFKTIDLGQRRTGGDALTIYSNGRLKDTNKMAAALRITRIFDMNEGFFTDAKDYAARMTPDETIEIYKQYPEVENVLKSSYDMTNLLLFTTNAVITGLKTYMDANCPKESEIFWKQFEDGVNLSEGSPILALRKKLMHILTKRGRKPERRELVGNVVCAWNMFLQGEEAMEIEFNVEDRIYMKTSK